MIGGRTDIGHEFVRRGRADRAEVILTDRNPERRTREQYVIG